MAEETTPGTAPVAAPTEPIPAPATPQPAQETTPTPSPPSGGGKTMEQLAQEVEEKSRYIEEVNERAARAEHEAMLTRNLVEQFTRGQGRPQEQVPTAPEVSDDEFLTNPAKATSKIIEGYFARDRAEREQERRGQYVNSARTAYETGKSEALKSNPKVFQGIEARISSEMLDTVKRSLETGNPIDADSLRNPNLWLAAAVAYRISEGEDLMTIASKYSERKVHTPMTPTHQETPTAGGPPKAEMPLTPEQEFIISKGNVTREAFMEARKKVRDITEEKNR